MARIVVSLELGPHLHTAVLEFCLDLELRAVVLELEFDFTSAHLGLGSRPATGDVDSDNGENTVLHRNRHGAGR